MTSGTVASGADPNLHTVLGARTRPQRPGPLSAVLTFSWRGVRKVWHDPPQIFEALATPIMFTVVFGHLLGGALAGSTNDYMQFYIPGIIVFTGIMISIRVGVTVNGDNAKEVSDRFRSLSIWRPAPIVGTLVGNNVIYVIGCVVAVLIGMALGFSPQGGFIGIVLAILLSLIFTFSFSWVYVMFGLTMKNASSAMSACQTIVFPVSFVSNLLVAEETMPGWLRVMVDLNPFSLTITAVRGLSHGTATVGQITAALIGCAVLIVIFAPLSMYLYRVKR